MDRGGRKEEKTILKVIDDNWEEFNKMIDDIFAGKKIRIKSLPDREKFCRRLSKPL